MIAVLLTWAILQLPGAPGAAVRCDSTPPKYHAAAYTLFPDPRVIHVDVPWCRALRSSPGSLEYAQGLLILTHEAGHVARGIGEACAEEYALANWKNLGRVISGPGWRPSSSQVNVVRWTHIHLPPPYRAKCQTEETK